MTEYSSTGDQMLAVLECVAQNAPISAAHVAEQCSINRTVAHRLLNTLIKKRYAQKTHQGYVLGPAAFDLSRSAVPGIIMATKGAMEAFAEKIDETVILHCISNDEAVVLDQVLSRNRLVMVRHAPGSRHSLNRGASGWALLSFQSPQFIEKYLNKLPSSERAEAKKRIARVQKEGIAISADELQLGVHGMFVPILNQDGSCDYSFGILVPSIRHESMAGLKQELIELGQSLSQTKR